MAKSEGGDSFARVISIAQIIWSALGISARSAKGLSNFSARDCSHHHRSMCCFHLSLKLEEAKRHHVAHHHSVFQEQDSSDGFKCFDQRKAARNDNPSFRANPKSLESVPFTRVIPVGCDVFMYLLVLSSTIFGAIHVAAWNFAFPTNSELILWKAASIYITASLPVMLVPFYVFEMAIRVFHQSGIARWITNGLGWFSFLIVCTYFVARSSFWWKSSERCVSYHQMLTTLLRRRTFLMFPDVLIKRFLLCRRLVTSF